MASRSFALLAASCLQQRSVVQAQRTVPVRPAAMRSAAANSLAAFKSLHTSPVSLHGPVGRPEPGKGLKVTYITPQDGPITVEAKEGTNLLDLAHYKNIDLEGACEGSLACSTCHVIVDPEFYSKLEEPSDEENDMLDLAFGLTDTSRLGCQIIMRKDLDGIVVRIPSATRNVQQAKLKK
ncbi:putative YAH1-ferredoxin of the mitochondrial matrix [Entophlyctis helioformis]|nr:putative YAH1-ferredoxin of the mitochondrial matrix [Entophlyctis helioformis]